MPEYTCRPHQMHVSVLVSLHIDMCDNHAIILRLVQQVHILHHIFILQRGFIYIPPLLASVLVCFQHLFTYVANGRNVGIGNITRNIFSNMQWHICRLKNIWAEKFTKRSEAQVEYSLLEDHMYKIQIFPTLQETIYLVHSLTIINVYTTYHQTNQTISN